VSKLGPKASYIQFDISDHKNIPSFVKQIEEQHGAIDILVNNAGKHLKKLAQDTTDEEFLQVVNVNLLSVFALTRCCADYMLKRKSGCILMISSMTALFGVDRVVAYGTSKTALTGLINNLVTEYSKNNVRVNAIAPGWIESDIFFKAINGDEKRRRQIENRIAMEHFGQPQDVAHAAVYLCSEAARYVTGVVLPVDGGAAVNM
jgi:gluconate 5-dehydrogenase